MDLSIGISKKDHKTGKNTSFDAFVGIEDDNLVLFMPEINMTLEMDTEQIMRAIRINIMDEKGFL